VCDALPHRKAVASATATTPVQHDNAQGVMKSGWLVQLLGGKREEVAPEPRLPVPIRAAA